MLVKLTPGLVLFFQCSDPLKCSIPSNNDDHVGPVAQQMSQRGPFFVIDKRDALEMSHRDGPQTSHNNEQETSHFNSNKPPSEHF